MRRRSLFLVLFACLAAAQLAVPLSMIVKRERVLSAGREFKFKCAPVDPEDAFRGRYVWLSFEIQKAPVEGPALSPKAREAYALLTVGEDGFAKVTAVAAKPPAVEPYLKVRVSVATPKEIEVTLPFDRYYMDEAAAPRAEKAYREHTRRGALDAYATVRVLGGLGVIEDLVVGGKPIREVLREIDKPAP